MIQVRRLSMSAALLFATSSMALAQANSSAQFIQNASSTFEMFAGQARLGFFGDKSIFETLVKKASLSKKDGNELLGTWWSIWEGENPTGHITAYAAFPDLDKKRNHFWVRFDIPTEIPMAQALLSHLLGKARETAVSSGDTVDIRLPVESILGGCTETYTLRIRMTSGALVSNVAEYYCPLK
jgi:hypothetical protein